MEQHGNELKFKTLEEYLKYEEERQNKFNHARSEDELREEYMKKIGEPIAMYCIMGNNIFREKFESNQALVYEYCLKHNKTWEEVLGFEYKEGLFY